MFKCNICGKEYNSIGCMKEIRIIISGASFFKKETCITIHICESCYSSKRLSVARPNGDSLFPGRMEDSVADGILDLIFPINNKQLEKVDKLSFLDDE